MKKIPCVFLRHFDQPGAPVYNAFDPQCRWVAEGQGFATRKLDGTACLVRGGKLYKRYDAKRGKPAPEGFEPCGEPDAITGHHPGWIPVQWRPEDVYHQEAFWTGIDWCDYHPMWPEGTYELVGPKVQGGAEGYPAHTLIRHGAIEVECGRTFHQLRSFLESARMEGIVFHHPDGRMAKIRRKDFGFSWPVKENG